MEDNDIIFLDIDDVIEIHNIALKRYWGQTGIRDHHPFTFSHLFIDSVNKAVTKDDLVSWYKLKVC